MIPETEFVLEALDGVVDGQDEPLHRIDRDNSRVYESGDDLDQTEPIHRRKQRLQEANLVGVAAQSRANEPSGTAYNLAGDMVASVRVEGLHHREYGHIDPDGEEGVDFDDLVNAIRMALLDKRTYPDHDAFRDAKLDLRITNEDYQSSDWRDYYRREFDVVFRAREQL